VYNFEIHHLKKYFMKKIFSLLLAALGLISVSFAQTAKTWNVDKMHSSVKFAVSHLVISEVDGSFKIFDGNMVATKEDFTDAKINFTVDVNSINTDNSNRDGHLKSDDFFNAEKYPNMTFVSTSFKKKTSSTYELIGDLTIRDVTKKVSFAVQYGGTTKDPYGNTKAGFKATGTINRLEYGLKWNTLTEAGGTIVGSKIDLTINLEMALAK
jgi:polyisoprenoid-binding protein YceI